MVFLWVAAIYYGCGLLVWWSLALCPRNRLREPITVLVIATLWPLVLLAILAMAIGVAVAGRDREDA